MSKDLIVAPNKNEFLLYSLLLSQGLMRDYGNNHPLRIKTQEHFKDYKGIGLTQDVYRHHSKPVLYVLYLNEAPNFTEKIKTNFKEDDFEYWEIKFGKTILPYLKHFYENTDFEEYYQSILSEYQELCNRLQKYVDKYNLNELLNKVWQTENEFKMEVIPMPLEGIHSGIGPSINNIAYPVVGPPYETEKELEGFIWNLFHEGSHPRAKVQVSHPIFDEINKRKDLLEIVKKNQNYSKYYNNWSTCFEEHLIRTMQIIHVPGICESQSKEGSLKFQYDKQGMVFINDFYEVISEHKDQPIKEIALKILEKLDEKYGGKIL